MNSKIDEIKKQIRIKDVVQNYLTLTKKGKNYWAICPFHSDTKPSLSVSEEKNIFKCFSCGCVGDGIFFIMKKENISFADAIAKAGQLLNIQVNSFKNTYKPNHNLFQITEIAKNGYQMFLQKKTSAIEWLIKERKLTEDLIAFFNIGYSGKENLLEEIYLRWNATNPKEKISFFDIDKLGILKQKYQKIYINFFQERIMFPIFNEKNQVQGFSGRTINDNENIKYLNSPESKIFKKSETLYNIQNLKKEQPVYVFEGFFDVISAHKIGFTNGVAIMGSALSKKNLKIISEYNKKIIFCFDNDSAGIKNTINSAKAAFFLKIDVYVVFFNSENKDIDSFINSDEIEAKKALENPMLFFDWFPKFLKYKNSKIDKIKISKMVAIFVSWIFNVKTKQFLGNIDLDSAKYLVNFAFGLFDLIDGLSDEEKNELPKKEIYLQNIENWKATKPAVIKIIKNKKDEKNIDLIVSWIKHKNEIKTIFPDNEWWFDWKILDYASPKMTDIGETIARIINVNETIDYSDEISKYKDHFEKQTTIHDFFSEYFWFISEILKSHDDCTKHLNAAQKIENKKKIYDLKILILARTHEVRHKIKQFLDNN